MSMSTRVKGIIPGEDEKFKHMLSIYKECELVGIQPPSEVLEFFDNEEPDEAGLVVDIDSTEYSDDNSAGLEVDLTSLPEDVKILRFTTGW